MAHTHGPNFGRRVEGCGRCDELATGAEPICWNGSTREAEEARRIADIRVHKRSRLHLR